MLNSFKRLCLIGVATAAFAPAIAVADDAPDLRPEVEIEVPTKVAERMEWARKALRFSNMAIPYEGNQIAANQKTKGNAYNRMRATRQAGLLYRLRGESLQVAQQDPDAAEAGLIACTRGGNCGENATMSFHYLATRAEEVGQENPFQMIAVDGMDHAYVLIGDLQNDRDEDIVVTDSWVSNSEPVRWSDFDFFTADRTKINVYKSSRTLTTKGPLLRQHRRTVARALRASLKENPEPLLTETVDDPDSLEHQWNQPYPIARFNPTYTVRERWDVMKRRLNQRLRSFPARMAERIRARAAR